MTDLVWLIPLFPLLGFLINGLIGKRFSEQAIGWIGSLSVGASFVVALLIFIELIGTAPASRSFQKIVYTWMLSGDLNVPIGFLVDPLSMVMMMVVSGVGLHHPHLFHRVYARRIRFPPLFRLPESLRLQHADPRVGQQLPLDVRGLGRSRSLLVSSHRILL